MVLNISEQ